MTARRAQSIPLPVAATLTAPDECATMPELRQAIDQIDRSLVEILALRQQFVRRAAHIKGEAGLIRDPARIADVLDKVAAAAAQAGLDQTLARQVWQTMIERFIDLEMTELTDAVLPAKGRR